MKQKHEVWYEGFTLGMAAVDTLPVVLFAVGGAVAATRLRSPLFAAGIVLSTAAGCCKAGWKYVLALRRQDFPLLQRLFRPLMLIGFALMMLSVPFALSAWDSLAAALRQLPSLICLLAGCAGIALMVWFAAKGDRRSASANWAEQWTNTAAQSLFVLALILS